MERSDMRTVKNLEPCLYAMSVRHAKTLSEKCARDTECVYTSDSSFRVPLAEARPPAPLVFSSLPLWPSEASIFMALVVTNHPILEGCATRRTPLRLAARVTNRAALSCGRCPKELILRRESVLHVQFCTHGTSINVTTDHDC